MIISTLTTQQEGEFLRFTIVNFCFSLLLFTFVTKRILMDFAGRLNQILTHYELSASSFAERVSVGRSSISHLLSGRNKPSLEFVMSVLKQFPSVTLAWLVDGEGSFPTAKNVLSSMPTPKEITTPQEHPIAEVAAKEKPATGAPNLLDTPDGITHTKTEPTIKGNNITRVILLYADGTFTSHQPDHS
jgi:transcriptional regulator with XRE-family HTH domain